MFGTFTGTSITVALNVPMFLTLDVMGNWTPGTFGGVTGGPFASELALSFTQIPAGAGIIGVTGDFSTPPPGTVVPEPSAIFMVLPGLAAGFVSYRIRRRRRGMRQLGCRGPREYYRISGAPDWLSAFDSAYDIEGKPAGSVTNEQCRPEAARNNPRTDDTCRILCASVAL